MAGSPIQTFLENSPSPSSEGRLPIMVNSCTGKMGKAVIEEAETSGIYVVPISFGSEEKSGLTYEVIGKEYFVQGPSDRESILAALLDKYPDLIVVDFTVSTAVNANAELYCKVGVPFVMGTTGGDRDLLFKNVKDSRVYAVISEQMGKQVVGFLGLMMHMAERFPGVFSGYSLEVVESQQASRVDASEIAKDVISCFNKLGVSFDANQIRLIRDPQLQLELVGTPLSEEHLACHAFHVYNLKSPDNKVLFEFQHNIRGRSIYAEGTIDAVFFLFNKIVSKDGKRLYNMFDVLREGKMEE